MIMNIYFLIDCSLYNLHSEKGKKKLKLQISQSLSYIRKYLSDDNLIIINNGMDLSFLGKFRGRIYNNINEFDFKNYNPVILDPYAKKPLNEEEIRKFNLYLIGGLVDLGIEWKYGTQYLFKDLKFESRKIELKNSIIGVPNRINIIIKIILDVLFYNKSLEDSIIDNQAFYDKVNRLNYDVKNGMDPLESIKYLKIDINKLWKYKNSLNKNILKALKDMDTKESNGL